MRSSFENEADKLYREICQKFGVDPIEVSLNVEEKSMSLIVPVRSEDFVCPLQTDWLAEELGSCGARHGT